MLLEVISSALNKQIRVAFSMVSRLFIMYRLWRRHFEQSPVESSYVLWLKGEIKGCQVSLSRSQVF